MNQTTIKVSDFDSKFSAALPMALLEALKPGSSFTVLSEQDPADLKNSLHKMNSEEVSWSMNKNNMNLWEVTIQKHDAEEEDGGCCGVCGG